MAEPTKKSPAINRLLDQMADREAKIKQNICVKCKKPAIAFKDIESKHDYAISGMCQVCQDEFYGED